MSVPVPDLPTALATAVADVRARAGAPLGTVMLLVPGEANGVLARQALADAGPWVRVEAWTPAAVVRDLGALALAAEGRRPEPFGWRSATLGVLVRQLAAAGDLGPHGTTLVLPGWRDALAEALDALEGAGLDADALRAHPPADPSLAERQALLATLLAALEARRREEDLYGPRDLAVAARAALEAGVPSPARRAVGAVLLGDERLPRAVHDVLAKLLGGLPVARIDQAPLDALGVEAHGIAAAAPHAVAVRVAAAGGALGRVQERLFRSGDPVALDATITLARASDDVREVREAARFVQDAVLAGTPLDRIAVALPTGERADAWWGEMERAGLPATWLVGPPLGREPAARVLGLVVDLALGNGTPRRWYELLRQPGLRLRARLGPEGTAGRGRWRRLLEGCGPVRGTEALLAAIPRGDTPEDLAAAASLRTAMAALSEEFSALAGRSTLGAHAGRLAGFLRRWWARSRDREQVLQMLDGWASARAGFPFGLAEAAEEIGEALASTPALSGALTEPRVRVLSPAALLGGAFDVVVMPGLAHGRFPAEPRDHPILPDALRDWLGHSLGADLPSSAEVRRRDQRKFATAVAACRSRLVLLWPETDHLDGRPRLPGEWALATASAALGRRAGYRDVEALSTRVGSRARPHVEDPARALGVVEHLRALAARDRAAAVRWLAAEPVGRRLLALQRSPWRLAREGVRDAWSGQVTPTVLACPGLDGSPLRADVLAALPRDPGRFFFERVLGAWPARPLPDGLDLLDDDVLLGRLVAAIEAGLDAPGALDDLVPAAWAADLADLVARADVPDAERQAADALLRSRWTAARAHAQEARGPRVEVGPTRLFDDLPWTVEGEIGRHAGLVLVRFGRKAWDVDPRTGANALIGALAAVRAGRLVTEAANVGPDRVLRASLEEQVPFLAGVLAEARDLAAAGTWPWGKADTFRLADEPEEPPP